MYDSDTALRLELAISKITPFLLAAVLLLPFMIIFWRMARFQPKPEAEVRAQLQKMLDEISPPVASQPGEEIDTGPAMSMDTAVVSSEQWVGVSSGTARWIHLYPRRWVGIVGLLTAMVLLALVGFSSWFRAALPMQLSRTRSPSGPAFDPNKVPWGSPPDADVGSWGDPGKKK